MIYSRWRPEGGYDYFQDDKIAPLGDDLPVPRLQVVNGIGAPSVSSGRSVPADAVLVGSGELPRGVIAPMGTVAAGQLFGTGENTPEKLTVVLAVLAAFGLGIVVSKLAAVSGGRRSA